MNELDGLYVLDDFYAITVPPAKGSQGQLKIITPESLLHEKQTDEEITLAVEFPITYAVLSELKAQVDLAGLKYQGSKEVFIQQAAGQLLKQRQKGLAVEEQQVMRAASGLKPGDVAQNVSRADEVPDDETAAGDVVSSEVAHIAGYLEQREAEKLFSQQAVHRVAFEWLERLTEMLVAFGRRAVATSVVIVLQINLEDLRRLGIVPGETLISKWFPLNNFFDETIIAALPVPTVATFQVSETWKEIRNKGFAKCFITPIPILRGDHLFRHFRKIKLVEHHGIYMGNGRIIHFSGNEFSVLSLFSKRNNTRVKATNILRFMQHGSRLRIMRYDSPSSIEETLAKAEASLTDDAYGTYDLVTNNCEHFARWCKTGKARSKQVETAAICGGIGAVAMGMLTALILVRRKR